MKSELIVEIETPDKCEVFPEEGQSDEDFEGKEKQKELEDFREEYTKDLHKDVVDRAKRYFDDELFEEQWLDDAEELSVDGYESFDDYGIKIKTEVKTTDSKKS